MYPFFMDTLGFHGTFWMYGAVMFLEVVYGAFSIPENKGESLVATEDKMVKDTNNEIIVNTQSNSVHNKAFEK